VGVVGDARLNALNDDDAVEEYWSAQADDMPGMSMVVKISGPPESFTPVAKAIAESLDPKIFPEIRPLKSLFRENVSRVEQIATVVSLIGIVAGLLAGVGIVGLHHLDSTVGQICARRRPSCCFKRVGWGHGLTRLKKSTRLPSGSRK
jgi:hypothetical protein